MSKKLLFRLAVLVTAMMCALGVSAQEAYAVYTSENTTLSFYYDNDRSTRTGTTYDLNDGPSDPGWVTDFTNLNVKQVVFDPSFADARPTSTFYWFSGMRNLESLTGLEYLNTSEVTRMDNMFNRCYKLTSLNLEKFNLAKVTDMSEMFRSCSALQTIYVGNGWKMSEMALANSHNVFKDCTSLVGGKGTAYDATHVDADYAHIDGGTDNPGYLSAGTMSYVCYTPENTTLTFYYDNQRDSRQGRIYDLNEGSDRVGWELDHTCSEVTNTVIDPSFANARPTTTFAWFYGMKNIDAIIGLEYLNTSEVTNMTWMFGHSNNLEHIDVSHFNTDKVTSMYAMFGDCQKLKTLDLTNWNTANVTNMDLMFAYCLELKTVYVGSGWNTDRVTESEHMFINNFQLVGGKGTAYDVDHVDAAYAHIDGGPDYPGYFTDKNAILGPYACYTADNTTLTFYYDDLRNSRPGTTYDLVDGIPEWHNDLFNESEWSLPTTRVVFDPSFADARPTSTSAWFLDMENLSSITGLSYLNTSEVTDMSEMFSGCITLASIDLSHFNTSKVTDMHNMFTFCYGLTSLDLRSFDTRNVTNMYQMFYFCDNLTSLNLSSFNTSKVTDMIWMFFNCYALRTIYAGNGWSTEAVSSSLLMFSHCTNLVGGQGTTYSDSNPKDDTYAHIDGGPSNPGYFTEWKEAYVVYTEENTTLTFYCDDLRNSRPGTITYDLNEGIIPPGWVNDNIYQQVTQAVFDPSFADARPTTTCGWFDGMNSLQSISGMNYLNTSEVTTMIRMFSNCSELTSLDLSNFNTDKVAYMAGMFNSCKKITSLDLCSFNTSNVTNMLEMFNGCSSLQTIYVSDGWSTAALSEDYLMFMDCNSLVGGEGTAYDANHVNASYAHIDGGADNPGYFTDPYAPKAYVVYTEENTTLTFYYDHLRDSRQGTTYDLNTGHNRPGWQSDATYENVTKVVFDPSFADARPTTTYEWFHTMRDLESIIGLRYLNTSEVTNMEDMFTYCLKLTSLDLSHFNTSKVTKMDYMFDGCSGLTILDLSGFNPPRMADTYSMFAYCTNLRTIYGRNWDTSIVSNSLNMFYRCNSLVGGQGTTFDPNHIDKAYAHIDGGPSNPGYFTDKNASLRGDVNGDGNVNISDVTALINYLLTGSTTGINVAATDCNQDSNVNISDVTALINYLLSGTW